MTDLVSIIIPTYKRSRMLDRAIKSCLNQSYKNIEIIVVDDNEPNSEERKITQSFMQKYYNNPLVKYVKRKKNGGGALARNTGVSVASGNYVAFLDDDDVFDKKKIEKQLRFMIKYDYDASFTASQTYDEDKKEIVKIKKYQTFYDYDNVLRFHLVEMIVGTQTFMYKKEVFKKIGGFENIPAGQEYYLMYKTLINNYKVGYLDEILTTIFIHSEERITTNKNKILAEKLLYNLKICHKNILNFSDKRKIKYRYKYNVFNFYYKTGNYFKAFFYIFLILICHPIIVVNKIIERKK